MNTASESSPRSVLRGPLRIRLAGQRIGRVGAFPLFHLASDKVDGSLDHGGFAVGIRHGVAHQARMAADG